MFLCKTEKMRRAKSFFLCRHQFSDMMFSSGCLGRAACAKAPVRDVLACRMRGRGRMAWLQRIVMIGCMAADVFSLLQTGIFFFEATTFVAVSFFAHALRHPKGIPDEIAESFGRDA